MLNPNDFTSFSTDTGRIQAAVDAAVKTGETVVIPAYNARTGEKLWVIDSAVKLYSGSTVILEGAHLRMADGVIGHMFMNSVADTPDAGNPACRQHAITLRGIGNAVLDGGNHNGLVERNSDSFGVSTLANTMLLFQNADRVSVENLEIVNARYWAMTFHYCAYGRVSDIRFMSAGMCPNNDGIDLRLGCHNFVIENISGYTQDDTVALTALNDEVPRLPGTDGSIHNVVIRNISSVTPCANVRLLNHYGHKLYNIIIENVQTGVETEPGSGYTLIYPDAEKIAPAVTPVYWSNFENGSRRAEACVRIGENRYFNASRPETASKPGELYNITVRNVQACSRYGVTLSHAASDVVIDNVQMFGPSACAVYFGKGIYDNVRCENLSMSRSAVLRPSDAKPVGGAYAYEEPAAVLFRESELSNVSFRNVTAHPEEKCIFAGTGKGRIHVQDAGLRNEEQTLSACAPEIELY